MRNKKFIRKTLAVLLSLLIFSAVLMPIASVQSDTASANVRFRPHQANTPFQDVPRGAWFHRYVSWAWVNGIAEGPSTTRFNPNANITRAEFIALLYRIAGSPASTPGSHFTDVPRTAWFAPSVEWARHRGITTGMPAGSRTFRPSNNITRQEMAAMIQRTLEPRGATPAIPATYVDRASVSGWAVGNVGWAINRGVMGVATSRLNPRGNATRAEAVAMLSRAVDELRISTPRLPPVPFINVPRGESDDYVNAPNPRHVDNVLVGSLNFQFGDNIPQNITTTYTPTASGMHRFELSAAVAGNVSVSITAPGIAFTQDMASGDTMNVNLVSGITYAVAVTHISGQPWNNGTLRIWSPFNFTVAPPPFVPETTTYTATANGIHRFELLTATVAVLVRITGNDVFNTNFEQRMAPGDTMNVNLVRNIEYTIQVRHIDGQPQGAASVRIWPPVDLRADPANPANPVVRVNDHFQVRGIQNNYTLYVPDPGGVYRFEISGLPLIWATRVSVRLEILRGNSVIEHGTAYLANGEGLTLDLPPGQYTIRVTPATGVPDNQTYSLHIRYPRTPDEPALIWTNPRGTTRGDVLVNDNFGYIGQQNGYRFFPQHTGAHTFTFVALPANGQAFVEIFGQNDFYHQFHVDSLWQGESINLRSGIEYQIRIRHMAGNSGSYRFVIANP